MGGDDRVVDAARVSMDKKSSQYTKEQNEKLINYLAKHDHWTPFAHVVFTFRIKMPIFVARQWFKHTVGLNRNEVSRRYVSNSPEFWYPGTWREAPEGSVKQGSGKEISPTSYKSFFCTRDYSQAVKKCEDVYNYLIEEGVAPEQARAVLPQAMYTEFVETGSLVSYARICNLRLDSHAQKEIREYAQEIYDLINENIPYSWSKLVDLP